MTSTYYALRHVKTGKFMPQRMSRSGRGGWSYWQPEPGSPDEDQGLLDDPMRLFVSLVAARNARSQWVRGHHSTIHIEEGNGYFELPEVHSVHQVKACGRETSDLEIVEISVLVGRVVLQSSAKA